MIFLSPQFIKSFIIPNGVRNINDYAFSNCSSLNSITIPEGVNTIGSFAFEHCYNLSSICIPISLHAIGFKAFYCCSALTSIIIPKVSVIASSAFEGCTGLTSITVLNPIAIDIDYSVFAGVDKKACTLHIPSGGCSSYQFADVWKEFGLIVEDAFIESFSVEMYENKISITGDIIGKPVEVFTSKGINVCKMRTTKNEMKILLPKKTGEYVIKVGDEMVRIVKKYSNAYSSKKSNGEKIK